MESFCMFEKEYLDFSFEVKSSDDDKGIIEGHGAVFGNVDFHGDIIEKGAFNKTLKKKKPVMLLQHDSRDVIGMWTLAKEDDEGLKLRGNLNMNVEKARDAFFLAKQGALTGLSVGFIVKDQEFIKGVRIIKEVELLEVSLVTFPANELAQVEGVKSELPSTERELEAALRKLGYGRTQAKSIVSDGFKGFQAMQRDADDSEKENVQRDADEAIKSEVIEHFAKIKQTLKE